MEEFMPIDTLRTKLGTTAGGCTWLLKDISRITEACGMGGMCGLEIGKAIGVVRIRRLL